FVFVVLAFCYGFFLFGLCLEVICVCGWLFVFLGGVRGLCGVFAGGNYAITDRLCVAFYGAKLEDFCYQYYGYVNYALPL
ncbi:hypothetical protein RA275_29500, partial [Pseudomonas syringae pv. tagetis]